MMTQTEKFRVIFTKAHEQIGKYVPSYHMLRLYKDLGHINEAKELSIQLMTNYVSRVFETLETAQLVDWDEAHPVLLYFLDENSIADIFSYIESIMVVENRRIMFAGEIIQQNMKMGMKRA